MQQINLGIAILPEGRFQVFGKDADTYLGGLFLGIMINLYDRNIKRMRNFGIFPSHRMNPVQQGNKGYEAPPKHYINHSSNFFYLQQKW